MVGILQRLRALTPTWPVSHAEARWIAEQQAALLIAATGLTKPPVPLSVITDIDGINIFLLTEMPVKGVLGASRSSGRGGDILIDCTLPLREQRLTLLHELKHIIDGERGTKHYKPGSKSGREALCTHFATNVLMPAAWIERDWQAGRRSVSALAKRYQVSTERMEHRLEALGLVKRRERQNQRHAQCQWYPAIPASARGSR